METPNYPWSLWAYCPTTKKKTLVARGPESEMRNIFDRLVRRDDRLELLDPAGEKQSTTAGPLTDSTGPEAINCRTLQLDFPPGRLNALTDRIADLEQLTNAQDDRLDAYSDRLNALADLLGDHERRLSNLETAQPSEPDDGAAPLGPNARRLNAIEQTNATIARRLLAIERKQSEDRKIRETYQADQSYRLAAIEAFANALADRLADLERLTDARLGDLARRLSCLEKLTKNNADHICRNLDEARSFATTVGEARNDQNNRIADLRRDLETLAAQVEETEISRLRNQCKETAAAVAKITSALSILSAFNRPTAPPNA